MTHPVLDATTNRRAFLALLATAAAAAGSGGLLAACSKTPGRGGSATNVDALSGLLPNYKAMSLVKADIAGTPPVANGFLTYPSNLVDAVTDKPGKGGGTIKAMTPWWGPTPPGLDNSSYLKAVADELGVAVDFTVQDGNTYGDKLSAVLGARDVPDLLCVPSWEYGKIPAFVDAVKALFEDLTPFLQGDKVSKYPMLAAFPTGAWQYAVWGGRLYSVPWPTDGPFPWALFYRKDLTDAAGVAAPKTINELYDFGKKLTDQAKGVWAFGAVFDMVQMFHKVPGSEGGWRKKADGTLEHKYETPEYKEALEFTARLFREGLVHPDVIANPKGANEKQLFNGGKIHAYQDGIGAWRGMLSEQLKVTPTFNMQPVPLFSAKGGDPLQWGSEAPIFYTFIKKGVGQARVEELLGVLNWAAAPFGTKEWEAREYGVEGKHFTRGGDGSPIPTDLGRTELANQYGFIVGRTPAIVQTADVPNYVRDLLTYSNTSVKYLEKNPWAGIKLESPSNYSKIGQPTEDKIQDILRGRRPISELDQVVKDWRSGGGDEGRAFLAKALKDNGR